MKILITGGSGFIGINLIDFLLSLGKNDIINLDKSSPIRKDHIRYWINCNIMDELSLAEVFTKIQPEIVIHLAARTDTLSDNLDDYAENHIGTKNLLNVISKNSCVKRLIVTSTQYIYKSDDKPLPTEDDEYNHHTVYGQSKVLTEKYTRQANCNCIWTIVRPTNVWGPWHMRYPNELLKLIDKKLYFHPVEGEVIRTYGYVKNVVHQLYQVINARPNLVDKKTFYLGDVPIDSYVWLNEISLQLTKTKIRRIPKFVFATAAIIGDGLRLFKIPFPMYSKRFQNMIESYPAPTDKTVEVFGVYNSNMSENVNETILWLEKEGAQYFEYWQDRYLNNKS